SLAYGVSERLSLRLTVPTSSGTNTRGYADSASHRISATGIGDINLVGTLWLLNPVTHGGGNVAVGLGVKAPTGSHTVRDNFWTPAGPVQFPVHPGLQPGDGSWGILLEAQAFQRLVGGLAAYAFGAYQMDLRDTSDTKFTPAYTHPLSVPDAYHARFGLAYAVWPSGGLSASLGIRFDGITVRDVVGGSDGFRLPGHTTYLDPGLSIASGRNSLTLSVPIRLHGVFVPNTLDQAGPLPPGEFPGYQGDLAKYLVFLGYARRF
ncbi:MAG: hypothetical protein ACHQU1_08775, partial [Gemmatimonadales bacterium]